MKEIEVCLNGKDWIPVNKNSVDYLYEDAFTTLLIICDELAEISLTDNGKSAEAKENNAYKDEILSILQSITQLGRSSAIHCCIATQKPTVQIVPTILRSNPLAVDTLVHVLTEEEILGEM